MIRMKIRSIETDNKTWLVLILLILSLLLPNTSSAGNPAHGSKAAAMGTAFVAIADDPSAILHNPAGLTKSTGTNIYAGGTAVIPSTEFHNLSGESEKTKDQVFFPPHLYLSSDFGMENIVLGLGVYSPFGIGGRKWSENGLTKYISTESTIATVSVQPTLAWQITPNISIGMGVFYMYAQNEAEMMVDQSFFGFQDGKSSIEADGSDWGYNLGILLTPFEKLSFGFAYRSGVEIDQSGTAKLENIAPALQPLFGGSQFETNVHTTLNFPNLVSFGVAYMPTDKLTLGLDFEWGGWSSFDKQDLDFENEIPGTGLSDASISLDWENAWIIKIGTEYLLNDRLALRAGYSYVESYVPDHTLSPANPDADNHNISIGFGYKINRWVVDCFYMASFFEDRTVNNTILSGTYENFTHAFGSSIGYRF